MENEYRIKMTKAINAWMVNLKSYPGWMEWTQNKIGLALDHDDFFSEPIKNIEEEFIFDNDTRIQHGIILQYTRLEMAISSLKNCEYYFRRYNYKNLPLSRNNHIYYICEMYFHRIYEFKDRMRKYLNAIKEISKLESSEVSNAVRRYEKSFKNELLNRNHFHNNAAYGSLTHDRLHLLNLLVDVNEDNVELSRLTKNNYLKNYRRAVNQWVGQVRTSVKKQEKLLEYIAKVTLANCEFLIVTK